MSALPFLTDEEVAHMTRGLKQSAAKCRFLQRLGFRVTRRPDGTPLVFRQTPPEAEPANGPRWTR